MFTRENTTGYSDAEMATLNAEWQGIVDAEGLEAGTYEYNAREKQYTNEVASRFMDDFERSDDSDLDDDSWDD